MEPVNYFFFLCLFFRRRFFLLCLAIFARFLFLPLGINNHLQLFFLLIKNEK